MEADARVQQVDEILKALGRFFVDFSQFVHSVELVVHQELGSRFARTVVAGTDAATLLSWLHSIIADAAALVAQELSEDDGSTLRTFRRETQDLISERNRIAHDAWFVGWGNEQTTDSSTARRMQSRRSEKTGATVATQEVKAEDLAAKAFDARRLTAVVMQTGSFFLKPMVWAAAGNRALIEGDLFRRPSELFVMGEHGIQARFANSWFPLSSDG